MKRLPGFRYDAKAQLAHFEVILPGTGGKGRRRSRESAADVVEATTKYHAFRKRILDAGSETPRTFAGYVEKYGGALQGRVKTRTAERERDHLATLLPHFGKIPMGNISVADVKDFVAKMKAAGYHPTTINNAFAVLRKYLYDAADRRVIVYPFTHRAKEWHQKEPKLRLELTEDEREAFLSVFDDEARFRASLPDGRRFGKVVELKSGMTRGGPLESKAGQEHFERFHHSRLLFLVALETGLSKGDLFSLAWSSVDLTKDLIRFPREKTGVEAVIPISAALRPALKELQERRLARKDRRDLVLGEFSETSALRHFAVAKRLAEITRRLRFHDLRHSFACRHVSHGTDLAKLKDMMGHASVKTTERYSRVTEDAIRAAGKALDERLLNSKMNSEAPAGGDTASGAPPATDTRRAG